MSSKTRKKIGVDFDATTSYFTTWQGYQHTGDPIPKMRDRILLWLKQGHEVVIFTARICPLSDLDRATPDFRQASIAVVEAWCLAVFGVKLEVTDSKGGLDEIWDDRAIQVLVNTGETLKEAVLRIIAEESLDAEVNGESPTVGWLQTVRERVEKL